jgi:folate-binding Fe-S cluster repair protein YgfZ
MRLKSILNHFEVRKGIQVAASDMRKVSLTVIAEQVRKALNVLERFKL